MKFFAFLSFLFLTSACNNSAPVATSYKADLAQPAKGTTGPVPTGNAALGLTAFNASCVGCHATPDALTAAQKSKIAGAAAHPSHQSPAVKAAFTKDGANLTAFLNPTAPAAGGTPSAATGNAAKGETLLKASCDGCHAGPDPAELDKFSADSLDGKESLPAHSTVAKVITDNRADLKAALLVRPAP
jgi:hypothetical protein